MKSQTEGKKETRCPSKCPVCRGSMGVAINKHGKQVYKCRYGGLIQGKYTNNSSLNPEELYAGCGFEIEIKN